LGWQQLTSLGLFFFMTSFGRLSRYPNLRHLAFMDWESGTRKSLAGVSLKSLHVDAAAVSGSKALKAILKGTHKTIKAEKVVLYGAEEDIIEEGYTKEEYDLFAGYEEEHHLSRVSH
jgi:hypothetical protein